MVYWLCLWFVPMCSEKLLYDDGQWVCAYENSIGSSVGVGACLLVDMAFTASMMLEDIGSVYHVVAFKYRWSDFVGSGLSITVGLLTVENGKNPKSFVLQYFLGGIFAGLSTGAMWSMPLLWCTRFILGWCCNV